MLSQFGRRLKRRLMARVRPQGLSVPKLSRLIEKLPVPTDMKLSWQRTLLDHTYAQKTTAARAAMDSDRVRELEDEHRFEIAMHDEEEDAYITKKLLRTARRLRVPIPHIYKSDRSESDHWEEGRYTGRYYLTTKGISTLREEIRRELKARHELRSHWAVWLAALTGLVGAATGLVALLIHRAQ